MTTAEHIVFFLICIYLASSWIGASVFTYVWTQTRADRLGLPRAYARLRHIPPRDRENQLLLARRNEIVTGILAIAFWLYAIASTISILRETGIIHIPWKEGTVTVALLTTGNVLEMLIAIHILSVRRQTTNRARAKARPKTPEVPHANHQRQLS